MRKLLLISFTVSLFHFAYSQKDIYIKPYISAGFEVVPHKQMTDSTGSYTSKSLYFKLNVPLYKKINLREEIKKTSYFQLNMTGGFAFTRPEFDFSSFSLYHDLYYSALGLNALYLKSSKNLFLSQLHVSFLEDNYTISSPELRYTGFVLYHRIVTPNFGYHAGLAYSYVFGKGLVLPILGINSRLSKKTRLNVSLPIDISLIYRPDQQTFISLYLRPDGLMSHFSSNGIRKEPRGELLIYRQTQLQTGVSFFYDSPSRVAILAKTGMNFGRDLKFDYEETIIETGLRPSVFISLDVIFKLIKKKNIGLRKKKNEIELEDLLEQISPENIE